MLKLIAIGNIGQDAKINDYSGRKAIQFSICHNETYTNKEGVKETRPTWVNCTLWREAGKTEIAKYLTAGTKVYIEGRPHVRLYDKRDGTPGASLDMAVITIELLGSPRNENAETPQKPSGNQPTPEPEPEQQLPY